MNIKKCRIEPTPEPPPPDPCKLQKIRQKQKAGIWICEDPPVPIPKPPPPCLAICIEKIKNLPVEIKRPEQPIVCVVEREVTGTDRCDAIEAASARKPDLPWPGCPPAPTIPPPPTPDPCEEQLKRQKAAECKERMKRYLL